MSRRGEILKEMGLAPVWKLRTGVSQDNSFPEEKKQSGAETRQAGILNMDWPVLKARVAG